MAKSKAESQHAILAREIDERIEKLYSAEQRDAVWCKAVFALDSQITRELAMFMKGKAKYDELLLTAKRLKFKYIRQGKLDDFCEKQTQGASKMSPIVHASEEEHAKNTLEEIQRSEAESTLSLEKQLIEAERERNDKIIADQKKLDDEAKKKKNAQARADALDAVKGFFAKAWLPTLIVLGVLVVLAGIIIPAILFPLARHWIIAGAIGVAYILLWMWIYCYENYSSGGCTYILDYDDEHWWHTIINSVILVACIVFTFALPQIKIYTLILAGASLILSVLLSIKSAVDSYDEGSLVAFIDILASIVASSLALSRFFNLTTGHWIIAGTIALAFIVIHIVTWLWAIDDNCIVFHLIFDSVVLVAAIVFCCLSSAFVIYAMFLAGAVAVSAIVCAFIAFDEGGLGMSYLTIASLSVTAVAVSLFFSGLGQFIFIGCVVLVAMILAGIMQLEDDYELEGITWTVTVIGLLASVGFLFVSRGFALMAIFIAIGSIVYALISILGEEKFWSLFGLIPLALSFFVFFNTYGYTDMMIRGDVLANYHGDEEIVNVPEGIVEIQETAFGSSGGGRGDNIKQVFLPSTLKVIGSQAFNGCDSLVYVDMPDTLTAIGFGAFQDCVSLKEIKLPSALTVISSYTFNRCSSLETVHIGANVTKIDASAFDSCTSLKTIYFAGTKEQWDAIEKSTEDTWLYPAWDKNTGNYEIIFLK